jgi:hypothetical protein
VNAQDTPESYEAYLEAVRKQEQRDRDRFTGQDSHDAEPMYDARTGQPEWLTSDIDWNGNQAAPPLTLDVILAARDQIRTALIPITRTMIDDLSVLRAYIERELSDQLAQRWALDAALDDYELLYGNSFHIASNGQMQRLEPLGIFNGASPLRTWHAWKDEPKEPKAEPTERTRHTYPKPKREWWRR